jgi:hypothetical protein
VSEKRFEAILREVDGERRDAEAFVATASPDIEWEDANYWTEVCRTYRGRRRSESGSTEPSWNRGRASTATWR